MSSPTEYPEHLIQAADALFEARKQRVAIPRISETFGVEGLEQAYTVAHINCVRTAQSGASVVGKKVGLTSLAVQQQLGVDQPDFGILFDDMEYLSGDDVPSSRFIQAKAEAEIAFVVGRELRSEKPSYAQFLAALDYAIPAIEIVDSAIENWKLTLVDTVADNASCGVYVLGNQPVAVGQLSLDEVSMTLRCNGQLASQGSGIACLGHPLRAAYWLACTMAARGEALLAGEVILSGALGPMIPLNIGDHIAVNIGGMGSVNCTFV
ncbi:2-keto-4-pentenoate hydratase [Zhongshania aliphaticivorans]|uniref:2-keto-4-pentenoate hydratase n=1 Tax=Zhongshania aliphaticivorans TaxID=1470434 RepID=A0A5S9PXE8_9GAMM|nr:fumarylacetoacetate hydrolase family protein [Zhongshania aliphaticivorans]CAA0092166.1 2-keto-4-pentenoate hydratase [Zhongshania aliphaticivorans]CAA0109316.1 2-keto-4-pentenoate hydratase [Zhongshania aliphaticivorans]